MKGWLLLVLLAGCSYAPKPLEQADPSCVAYAPASGEACRVGHWLWVDNINDTPRPSLCACDVKGAKR